MLGYYHLNEQELIDQANKIQCAIDLLSADQRRIFNLTGQDLAPCHIKQILIHLGWEDYEFDSNGWEQDTTYWFSHEDYSFDLIMYYTGYTFEMQLYRSDIDDE